MNVYFFFSSRRRHTRLQGDWSSDVCSSDLPSLRRRRLDLLAEHFGLSTAGRHRGLGDARMAAEILSIFLEIAENMGIGRLDRLLDLHGRGVSGRRLERHVSPEEIAALPLG